MKPHAWKEKYLYVDNQHAAYSPNVFNDAFPAISVHGREEEIGYALLFTLTACSETRSIDVHDVNAEIPTSAISTPAREPLDIGQSRGLRWRRMRRTAGKTSDSADIDHDCLCTSCR